MVRRCAVPDCTSTDLTILSHRLPRRPELAAKWSASLDLDEVYSLSDLIEKYTICCLHFEEADYRNVQSNHLNLTAIPKREPDNPRLPKSAHEMKMMLNAVATEDFERSAHDGTDELNIFDGQVNEILEDNTDMISCLEMETNEDNSCDLEVGTSSGAADYLEAFLNALGKSKGPPLSPADTEQNPEYKCDGDKEISIDNFDHDEDIIEVIDYTSYLDENSPEDEKQLSTPGSYCHKNESIDASVQVNVDELERSDDDEDEEYSTLSRKELISLLKDSLSTVGQLQQKLDNFQDVHSKLQRSMDAFKSLMGNL